MPEGRSAPESVRLAAVLLPAEHGGWGFVAEALCLMLLATPAAVGVPLTVATLAGFLAYQPLRTWLDDRQRRRSVLRTRLAGRAAATAGAIAAVAVLVALARAAAQAALLVPLALSGSLVAAQLVMALRARGRTGVAELLGATAPGGVAAASAAGQELGVVAALGLWALLVGRGVPAVLLVRARLRRDRGKPAGTVSCHAAHGAVVLGAAALAGTGAPALAAVVVFTLLWGRAVAVLAWPRPLRPQLLGMAELAIGFAAAVALGLTLPPLG